MPVMKGQEPYKPTDRSNGEPFLVEIQEDTLVLAGPIGQDAVPRLHAEALRLAGYPKDTAVDWSAAEHLSAGALQVLLALARARKNLRVSRDQPGIRSLLELAGVSEWFPAAPLNEPAAQPGEAR